MPPTKNIARQPKCGNTKKYAERGEQISRRVAFLQQPREDAASVLRRLLHRERRSDAPLAAHADAEDRAPEEEGRVGVREAGRDSDAEKKRRFAISAFFRPMRSASRPNSSAPTGRNISVSVSEKTIALSVTPNSVAMVVSVYVTRKKSNASSVQPRKLAATAAR